MAGLSNGRRRFLFRRRIVSPGFPHVAPRTINSAFRHSFLSAFALVQRTHLRASHPPRSIMPFGASTTYRNSRAHNVLVCVLVAIAVLSAFSPAAVAQQTESSEPRSPSYRVARVDFTGDLFFDKEQLGLQVRTRPNRNLLGIPGFTWWLWLHQFGSKTLGGGVGRAFQAMGEPPSHLDSTVVAADIERLRLFYEHEGFREAAVSVNVIPITNTDRVRVEFEIDAGQATYIRFLKYNGLDSLETEAQLAVVRRSLIQPEIFDPENPLSYRAGDVRYSEPLLIEERNRLMSILQNSGFADVVRNSIHAVIWDPQPDSFDVTIDIKLGPRYRFGDVRYVVAGPVSDALDRMHSEPLKSFEDGIEGGFASADFSGEEKLKFSVLRRALRYRPGDRYDSSRLLATKRRLDATGVFAFTEILRDGEDSTKIGAIRIDHRLNLQTRLRHQIRFQTFMLQRSGALDADNELGAGIGITYNNLNLFGGGESFQLTTNASLAADLGGGGGFTSAQWEVAASLSYPYLTFPFGALDRRLDLYDAKTRFSITFLAARRDALRLLLRGRGRANYRFELRHSRTLTSFLDLIDLTVSNPDTLDGFQEIFLDDILATVDDPVQRAQIIEDYTVPQFNNALRYTFRSANIDPFRRSDGYAYEGSFEVGGHLGYLLDRYVYSPDSLEGSLPGLPFFKGEGSAGRMVYRQYIRFVVDFRTYHRLTSRSVFAWKVIVGLAHPTGRADVIPLDRRFFSGGASSVRAWRLRELGPGGASFSSESDTLSTESTNIVGGEIKLEASVELRQTFARSVLAADWVLALFADAGNVWFGSRNPGTDEGQFRVQNFLGELGVGAGFGLRLAWDFLIVRLDLAYKVHDPLRRGDFFPDKLKDPILQFGIGHTF